MAINRSQLDNYTQRIILLLEVRANPDVQNQAGKTLLHYVAERNNTKGIDFLLGKGANPSVRDQSGKTPLHYAAENNCLQAIELLLKAKADQNMQDQSGKTPFEYVTERNCRQAIKDLGYDLDDSHENEGNPTNGSSNNPKQHYPDKKHTIHDDQEYSFGDDNKTISTEPSDRDRKDEDSSCSSSYYLFLEDSLLAKLEIPLTTDEQKLIDKFCKRIRGITAQKGQKSEESILESVEKIVDECLEEGIRLNSSCSNGNEKDDKETVTNLILEEIEGVLSDRVKPRDGTKEYIGRVNDITDQDDEDKDEALDIIESITSNLLLEGGKAKEEFFSSGSDTELAQNYRSDYIRNPGEKCGEIENKLISIAYEGIVGRDRQAQKGKLEAVKIDNQCFYMKYSQDSIIEPAKILNHKKAKELNLKVGILQIGESIVKVEKDAEGKRNYKDILKGSIKMSFTTEVGEISIYLSLSKEGGNKIKVEIDEENKAKFDKLKDKSSLGKDCLLEGENVSEVISKNFKMSDSVSTEGNVQKSVSNRKK